MCVCGGGGGGGGGCIAVSRCVCGCILVGVSYQIIATNVFLYLYTCVYTMCVFVRERVCVCAG